MENEELKELINEADNGNEDSQIRLMFYPFLTKEEYENPEKFYKQISEQNKLKQYHFGKLFKIKREIDKAIYCFKKSDDENSFLNKIDLGDIYYKQYIQGGSIEKKEKAINWYNKALKLAQTTPFGTLKDNIKSKLKFLQNN